MRARLTEQAAGLAGLLGGSPSGVEYERKRFRAAIPEGATDFRQALPRTTAWLSKVFHTVGAHSTCAPSPPRLPTAARTATLRALCPSPFACCASTCADLVCFRQSKSTCQAIFACTAASHIMCPLYRHDYNLASCHGVGLR